MSFTSSSFSFSFFYSCRFIVLGFHCSARYFLYRLLRIVRNWEWKGRYFLLFVLSFVFCFLCFFYIILPYFISFFYIYLHIQQLIRGVVRHFSTSPWLISYQPSNIWSPNSYYNWIYIKTRETFSVDVKDRTNHILYRLAKRIFSAFAPILVFTSFQPPYKNVYTSSAAFDENHRKKNILKL